MKASVVIWHKDLLWTAGCCLWAWLTFRNLTMTDATVEVVD